MTRPLALTHPPVRAFGPLAVTVALLAVALLLAWQQAAPVLNPLVSAPVTPMAGLLFYHSMLPRMATALLCGGALALSGALFQLVLRNPLASPTTLGVSAGANLALVLTTLLVPALLGIGRDLVALAGSAIATGFVFLIGARSRFSPISLVMSGLVVSLWCGALCAVLTLLNERYLVSLFIWGAGSLSQQSWAIPLSLAPKLAVIMVLSLAILRPLVLNELGEAGASALGVNMAVLRLIAVALAVALSAFVTSAVGVIGFIGLVSPTIARLSGARRPGAVLLWSTAIGAALLFLTDCAILALAGSVADFLPTGAVTAILGSPLLLILLPRLKLRHRVISGRSALRAVWFDRRTALVLSLLAALVVLLLAIFFGRLAGGDWGVLPQSLWPDMLALRLPRVVAAFAAGAMLAVAGTILQRLTGNEMASPEVLGISAGATLGVTVAVFVFAMPGVGVQLMAAGIGAAAVVATIFTLSGRSGFAPERVLLAGIALGAMVDAVIGVIGASGDPRAMFLIRWMGGSTYTVTKDNAGIAAVAAVLLVAIALLARRWLDILPLGTSASRSLGLSMSRARLGLMLLAAGLSGAATMSVGPLSFVGLMAPHLAAQLGLRRAFEQTLGGALIGGVLMVAADWLGRSLVYPYEVPAGLVSALIGAPFLAVLMGRGR